MSMEVNKWKEIWSKRLIESDYTDLLSELIRLDGFDGKTGKIELDSWDKYISFICEKIDVRKDDTIFEIGCGSGAFLYPFYREGYKVEGVDYSPVLVDAAKKLWNAPVVCCEADQIPVYPQFDVVVSNSVFFYFPDLDYARRVIERMIQKAKRVIAILELPNKDVMDASENMRKKLVGENVYEIKYKNLKHLYYSKDWLKKIGDKFNLETEIFDQNIEGYNSNDYRFNCIYLKKR